MSSYIPINEEDIGMRNLKLNGIDKQANKDSDKGDQLQFIWAREKASNSFLLNPQVPQGCLYGIVMNGPQYRQTVYTNEMSMWLASI